MKNIIVKNILILFSFSILFISCKTNTVVEYVNLEPVRGKIVLSADSVEVGQKITAHFVNMERIFVYSVMLNQKQVTFSQTNDSTVTLIVPFSYVGTEVGNFIFDCFYGKKGDTILVSNQIKYKWETWFPKAFITWNIKEKIVLSDTRKVDGNGNVQRWTVQTTADTIKIKRHIIIHDECSSDEILVFRNKGNNVLPEFLYAVYHRSEAFKPAIHYHVNSACKIMIDKWGDNSLYSGTFTSEEFCCIFGNLN